MTVLSINNLNVTLEENRILSDVSFEVPSGKLVGLIGPNGAGKSILIKSILGLIDGASGDISLDGKDINSWSIKERAQKISYAAQGAPVHWPLTVGHLVSLGRIPHLSPWQSTSTLDQTLTLDAMKKTDVDHLVSRSTTTLSGGERARAMLARAIVTGCEFLLADEPIEALDPYHQMKIMDILKELAETGHGVLLVLHDVNFAQKYCDELILLNEGQIISKGLPEDVLSDENLLKAYQVKATRLEKNGEVFIIPTSRINQD
ncbi:MAG: ABC transporter ATP-binding protein [Kordiimonadaceae bacterium]|nr:ABC transporter ATP-binding protein [Kordiimonadaceae bacterium]MBT6037134.1 ABC transporter ATP-binding protein [Kordiimonadaceae bacterium]MBT6330208.1 ABC transporter ATP-binding protein [Kordiimonadaceae bacterium]MBT7583576.1 ABC transporter ATP-binding protein [Kordiimonadaceae bacterium]